MKKSFNLQKQHKVSNLFYRVNPPSPNRKNTWDFNNGKILLGFLILVFFILSIFWGGRDTLSISGPGSVDVAKDARWTAPTWEEKMNVWEDG